MFKYMKGCRRLLDDISIQKETKMEERKAKTLVCDIFRQQIVHLRLFHPVSNDLLNIPTTDLTGWRLPADDWLSAFLSLFIRLHK
jgi:hypothetical protein